MTMQKAPRVGFLPQPKRDGIKLTAAKPDLDLVIALFTYAAASAADYFLTLSGIIGKEVKELNPVLNAYIDHFGAGFGLLVPKFILGVTVVFAVSIYLHAMHKENRTKIKPQHILYPGSIFTVLAPLHWVVLKALAG